MPLARDQCYNTFYVRNLRIFVLRQCFSLASLSRQVSCFGVRPGAYSRVEYLKRDTLGQTRLIRQGWKSFPGTNIVAYTKIRKSRAKSFKILAPIAYGVWLHDIKWDESCQFLISPRSQGKYKKKPLRFCNRKRCMLRQRKQSFGEYNPTIK